jgi:hypothetical protein
MLVLATGNRQNKGIFHQPQNKVNPPREPAARRKGCARLPSTAVESSAVLDPLHPKSNIQQSQTKKNNLRSMIRLRNLYDKPPTVLRVGFRRLLITPKIISCLYLSCAVAPAESYGDWLCASWAEVVVPRCEPQAFRPVYVPGADRGWLVVSPMQSREKNDRRLRCPWPWRPNTHRRC